MGEMSGYNNDFGDEYTDSELHDLFDEFLDEVYGMVNIGGYEYETSRTLKEIDPIAYRCGFSDWVDSETDVTLFEKDA